MFPPLDDGQDEGAGLGFAVRAVPWLRAQGWRIEVEESWPFRLHEGPVAFSTSLEADETDWFSLRLSLEADGRKFDVGPIVLQLVEELPVDAWGRLEEGFDIESHLAGKTFHARLDDGSWVALDGSRFARFAEAFLEAQGCWTSTGPMRAGCSSWLRLWKAAARRGPAGGRFSISGPG